MAILSNGKFYGFLCSAKETGQKLANGVKEYVEDFVSGFAGHGWKIWEYVKGKWMLEIDSIRVRGQFTVFEMLISKVRAIIGAQAITQGCGKVKAVELSKDGTAYLITLEDADMSFMEHDFIRCQEFTGSQKVYHVEIESIVDGIIRVPLSEFDLDEEGIVLNPPAPGDDIVQFGNSQNKARQSAIYLHADETGQPAIDVMFDINSKNWDGKVKIRVGGDIPDSGGLKGFYCENGMIKGTDSNGHTVYCIYPDGTAEFGDNSAKFCTDKSGYIAGGAISWVWNAEKKKCVCTMKDVVLTWDNLSDEAKENLKGEPGKDGTDGKDGDPGKDGQDANLLSWIEEWNGYATELGKEYIVTPKMFSGIKDEETGKLTGIAQGKDCIEIDGVKRTGIFALVEDKIVFELDPINRTYKFTGEIEANIGRIGNLRIDGNTLKALGFNLGIEIDSGDGRSLSLGGLYSSLISMRIDSSTDGRGNTGINIDSYGKNNVCLSILANVNSKFAIDSIGPHRFYQRAGEVWDAPGVLWAGRCESGGGVSSSWGQGAGNVKCVHTTRGYYRIDHEIGHSQYFVSITGTPYGEDDSAHIIGVLCDRTNTYFVVRIVDATRGSRNFTFEVAIFGRNRYNTY